MTLDLCEIRVPTYRRPELLRRALRSLIDQTHRGWMAVVMDDSRDGEGEPVVRELGDARIEYRRNERRLGAAGNLDQAFVSGPLGGGAFACVLEDDNWIERTCIAENVAALGRSGCPVLMRDQRVWEGGGFADRTTLGALYREGRIEPMALHARLFFGLGAANGALFWRTDARSRLQVGPTVTNTVLQEHCRTLQIEEPLWFSAEPLSAWSAPQGGGREIAPGPRRRLSRGRQSLHRHLWLRYGEALLPELREIARMSQREGRMEEHLGYIGVRLPGVATGRFLKWRLNSLLRALTTPDPLAAYFGRQV
ncbi:MAG: glycosyltransferase [Verrucomicrobiae bacterium]|nr:glycosyltransferase [Verrucomicrobiae bacterium]